MKFLHLEKLFPFVDEAFESFYSIMLSDSRLGMFFKDEQHIKRLIESQKIYFRYSLNMTFEEMKETYIKLGQYHHKLKIPYIDFIKGSEILQEHFILSCDNLADASELRKEVFTYFKLMKAFTAKGYLNKMLEQDLKDISSFNETIDTVDQEYLPTKVTLNKINWLTGLLHAINNNLDWSEKTKEYFLTWQKELEFVSPEKKKFFAEMEERILYDTYNLFYFLHKEEYTEILPLYTSLLNIYKLSLTMNNALTIKYADKVIDQLKLDQLTLLFRKDMFESTVVREMSRVEHDTDCVLSLALIDLDEFKSVNDNYGHLAGDLVLKKLGKTIRKYADMSEIGFRIGGDEFAILFKGINAKNAEVICAKIKNEFLEYEFRTENNQPFHVFLSTGISECSYRNKKSFEKLFKEADTNLYICKKNKKS